MPSTTHEPPPVNSVGPRPADMQLAAYTGCAAALAQLRAHAEQHPDAYRAGSVDFQSRVGDLSVVPGAEKTAGANDSTPEHSTTNDQEAGVDEPDTVENDGNRVVTVSGGMLRVVDTHTRKITGSLDLSVYAGADQAQLLMSGDRVLVMLGEPTPVYYPRFGGPLVDYPYQAGSSGSAYLLVDISGSPKVISILHPKGQLVDARMVDGTVRIVVDSRPQITLPELRGKHTAAQQRAADREAVAHTPLAAWLPGYDVVSGGNTTHKNVACTDVSHPDTYTGASLLTIYTVQLGKNFGDIAPVTLAADAATVYASASSLYVANAAVHRTQVHRFDISSAGKPAYLGSGTVTGNLLDAYSLSEYDGSLRAVTSERNATSVQVLDADTLKQTGHVDGLGRDEQIHAVRFLGPLAYLVTYRQVDPLFVVDLSDPKHPKAAGEVKVTGYSDYLHPVGNGRLLGVGQDVNSQQMVDGLQVSLFDVHDTAHPRRIANVVRSHTPGEDPIDPHAFLYWAPTGTAVIPIDSWSSTQSGAVLVVHVDAHSVKTIGLIRNPATVTADGYDSGIERSLWIGGSIWTLSSSGLKVSDATTLHGQAWIPFSS